ncbi:MAG: 2-iminoacetate synthase ThiH [Syntrophales bacterium]|nr:2-iminoacetate synthase ThiH [Syntrophales bacterium]
MSFFDILSSLKLPSITDLSFREVEKTLAKESLNERDLFVLLSKEAEPYLENMAQRAHRETLKHFGRTMRIYTPLYISDYCDNACLYCGFNRNNNFPRRRLSWEEVEDEGKAIAKKGFQDLLVLTGESRSQSPVSYIAEACKILHPYFPALSVEIYPLSRGEYELLHRFGVNGLTIYQETYDPHLYDTLHPVGPKRNFRFRLEAPERGGEAKLRWINIGVLLGLGDWRKDIFILGLHARYLMERFPHCDVGVGVPRLRPYFGTPAFQPQPVTDRNLVQIICALRLFLPRLNISLTTREKPDLRNNLIPLGITRISAGSVTSVGGHRREDPPPGVPQFDVADHRSLDELVRIIRAKQYEPVTHDWLDDAL